MKNNRCLICLPAFLITTLSMAQYMAFVDTFDDNELTLPRRGRNTNAPPHVVWSTLSPGTYRLTESDVVLHVVITKQEGSAVLDCITLAPPVL